jgi:hypothetical protein
MLRSNLLMAESGEAEQPQQQQNINNNNGPSSILTM